MDCALNPDQLYSSKPMGLDSESRIVMTLDAGGTNLRFAAMRGGKAVTETISLPSNGDDLTKCLANIVDGFTRVKALCPEPPSAISFAFPGPADYPNGIVRNGELFVGDNSMAGEVWLLRNKLHPEMNAEEGACIRAVRRVYAELTGIPFDEVPEPNELFEVVNGKQARNQAAALEAFRRLGEYAGDALGSALTLIDGLAVFNP